MTLPYIPAAAPDPRYGFHLPPTVSIIHAIESPIRAGLARSLAGVNYFGNPENRGGPGTSVHTLWDPREGVEGVHEQHVAYHCGPAGNPMSWGSEHTGHTAMTPEEWRTPDALAMVAASARWHAAKHRRLGLPWRWLSLPQLVRAARTRRPEDGGLATHADVTMALGGTTHTDPGHGFPYDLFLQYGQKIFDPVGDDVSWTDPIKVPGPPAAAKVFASGAYPAGDLLASAAYHAQATHQSLPVLTAAVSSLAAMVAAKTDGLTPQQILDTVDRAIRDATVAVDVTVHGGTTPPAV